VDFIIRGCQNRRLTGEPGYLQEALQQAAVSMRAGWVVARSQPWGESFNPIPT